VPNPCTALIDSGSSHCFVDSVFADQHGLPANSVPLIRLHLFDEILDIDFYVTPLDKSVCAVLGYSWLSDYNLLIDWKKCSIQFCITPPTHPNFEPPVRTVRTMLPKRRKSGLPGSQLYTLNLTDTNNARLRAASAADNLPDLSAVPAEYHKFADVFSKKKANILPEHWPYDLKIEIE
ncbi:hypothetical protein BC628DRAFT_1301773, partial [Trametes gibbosa]